MMEVFRDTDEMIYPIKAIKDLEELFWNFVWDMHTDDTDWGEPGLVVESDEEYNCFQGEVYSDNTYWNLRRIMIFSTICQLVTYSYLVRRRRKMMKF